MSKRLYLLRHAKSSWKQPELADRERPLAGRGRRAAKAIARHIRQQGIAVDLVLCSPSRRTCDTLDRIESSLAGASVRYEAELYAASSDGLLEVLRGVPDGIASVMLIGHNPGLEDLALEIARPSPERRDIEQKFPTGALATLEFDGPAWRDLAPGAARLVGFVRPRDLEA